MEHTSTIRKRKLKMANEYMNSNVFGAGLQVPAKVRKAATDKSAVNKDFGGGVGPGQAPMSAPRSGNGTASGPATVVQGVYTQPTVGGGKF
jgi:hypothetical protein